MFRKLSRFLLVSALLPIYVITGIQNAAAAATITSLTAADWLANTGSTFSSTSQSGSEANWRDTLYTGTVDDDYKQVKFPTNFKVWFDSKQYDETAAKGVYIGSNTYITFGAGSTVWSGVSASNPPNIPGLHMCAQDNSYQLVLDRWESNDTIVRVRYEGTNGRSGTKGSPNMVYEAVFYAGQAYFDVAIGTMTGCATGISTGATNGQAYVATFPDGTAIANKYYRIKSGIAPTFTTSQSPLTTNTQSAITFNMTLSESATGVDNSDFANSGTATGCAFSVSGSGTTYSLSVSSCSTGTVIPKLIANSITGSSSGVGPGSDGVSGVTVTIDRTAPTASVTTASIIQSGNAVVQSTEIGTAYLVNTSISVTDLASITNSADALWNSISIATANSNTNLPATGLSAGTYKVYAVDVAGNLSSASTGTITVGVTLTTPTTPTVAATANTLKSIYVSWSAVTNASSYQIKIFATDGTTLITTISGLSSLSRIVIASDFSSPVMADSYQYKIGIVAVGDGTNYINSAQSTLASVTTNSPAVAPTISLQPANTSVSSGSTASFSVTSTVSDGGTQSYQWKVSTDSGSTYSNVSTGTGGTTASYTTGTLTYTNNGYKYQVVVTNTKNGTTATSTSSAATLSITAATTTITLSSTGSPTYNSAYTLTATTSVAGSVNFKLAGSTITGCGAVATSSLTATCSWTPASAGSASITATLTPTDINNYAISNTASALALTVNQITPTISIALPGSATTATATVPVTITATVSVAGNVNFKVGGTTITNCGTVATSAGSATCSWTPASAGTSSLTATLSPTDSTNYATANTASALSITVAAAAVTPTISSQPTSTSVAAGSAATFSVTATTSDGGTLSYQWQVSTNSGSSWSNVASNGTNSSYSTGNVLGASNNYQYRVTITNTKSATTASATSNAATLTVTTIDTTITVAGTGSNPVYSAAYILTATTSVAGSVNFKVGGITINGCGTVSTSALSATCTWTPDAAGSAAITAVLSPTDTSSYKSSTSSTVNLTVDKAAQSTLSIVQSSGTFNQALALTTSGGSGGGAVTFQVVSAGTTSCTINGSNVSSAGAGTCTIKAKQDASANYLEIFSADKILTFAKANQNSLTITSISGSYGMTISLTTSGGSGTGSISYRVDSAGSANCSILNSSLSASAAGTCLISATKASDNDWNEVSSASTTITISSSNQLNLVITTTNGTGGTALTLQTSGGSGTGSVTYSVTNGANTTCALSGSQLTATVASGNPGTCVVTATKAADSNYLVKTSNATTIYFTSYTVTVNSESSCTSSALGTSPNNLCQQLAIPTGSAPKISSLSTNSGAVGATITITGTSFTGVTKVQFGTKLAVTFNIVSGTSITAVVPSGATTGRILVANPYGSGMSSVFTVVVTDTQAPSLSGASVNTSQATQIILTFDENLAATSTSASAFAVTVAGNVVSISSITISSTQVLITLAVSVTHGQGIAFTYTSPNDGTALQDAAGNKTSTIGSTAVTNNVP